jgi:DUF4097 and DUF4098 domain-containing protein YvlB
MLRYRLCVLVAATAFALGNPANAAVTRGAGPEENPRAGWLERYQESRQGPEQTERFTGTYKVGAEGALDLQNISGDIRVTTGGGGEIRVEAVKRVRHRDPAEAKRYLGLIRIEASTVGGRVEIRTVYPRTSGRQSISSSVDYTVVVPQRASVALKSISGDVTVSDVRGEVRAETISGDVDVTATPNLALAKTVSGDVRARDIGTQTTLILGTVSGAVIATALKVRALEAGSVSGDIQLSNLQVERLTAKTVTGNVAYDGALQRGSRYEFNAHSGDVRLVLPANTGGFELDASSFSGSIRTDFPVQLRGGVAADRRRPLNRAVRGTYGDAGALVSVRSFSGSVVIVKR